MSHLVFFTATLAMTWATDVIALSTSRRTDDVDLRSLVTLVEQQAATILKQEARLQALEARMVLVQHAASGNSARLGKPVAFSVRYSGQGTIDVGSQGTLKYDHIITNVGNGYVPHLGIFTAPYSGVYAFFTSLRSTNDHTWIELGIYKDSTALVKVTGEGSSDAWDRGSAFVLTHMNAGEQTYVKQDGGSTFLEAGPFTTFSGMLVTVD